MVINFEAIEKYAKPHINIDEFTNLADDFKKINAGEFSKFFEDGKYSLDEFGVVNARDVSFNEFLGDAKAGKLDRISELNGSGHSVSVNERANYKKLAKAEYPHADIADIEDSASSYRKTNVDIDVKAEQLDEVPAASKEKINKFKETLTKFAKATGKIVLVLCVIVVGAKMLEDAINKLNGCKMITKLNGKSTSCNLPAYTCFKKVENEVCGQAPTVYVNPALYTISLINATSDQIQKFAEGADVETTNLTKENMYKLLNDGASFKKIANYVATQQNYLTPNYDVCQDSVLNYEGGLVPGCRLCDSSASPLSTTYVDSSMFGQNIMFKCIQNSTLIDLIGEVATELGINPFGSGISCTSFAKNILIVIIVIVIIYFLFLLISRNLKKQEVAIKT